MVVIVNPTGLPRLPGVRDDPRLVLSNLCPLLSLVNLISITLVSTALVVSVRGLSVPVLVWEIPGKEHPGFLLLRSFLGPGYLRRDRSLRRPVQIRSLCPLFFVSDLTEMRVLLSLFLLTLGVERPKGSGGTGPPSPSYTYFGVVTCSTLNIKLV